MHGSDEPAPPMTGVPHRMARVIDKLLAKDPDKRFQSAAEALSALEHSHAIMTPASGIHIADGGETNPSIGPFPAQSAEFARLAETPLPNSLVNERAEKSEPRRRPSATEQQRIADGATMIAPSSAPPAVATSQHAMTAVVTPKSKVPLIAAIGGTLAAAIVAFVVLSGGGGDKPATPPTTPEPVKSVTPEPPPPPVADKPPMDNPPVADTPPPVEDKPATATTDKPADKPADKTVDTKTKTKAKTKTKTGTTATQTRTEPPKPPEQKPPTNPPPPKSGALPF
jgi:hypothetical protein